MSNKQEDIDFAAFISERNEALLQLDEAKCRAFFAKWNDYPAPSDPLIFMASIHKVVTGCLSLPKDHRQKSKDWLKARGFSGFDDGDLD